MGHGDDDQEDVGASGDKHTERNLPRRGDFLALASQRGKNPHDNRRQHNHEERVDELEDLRRKGAGIQEVAGKDRE